MNRPIIFVNDNNILSLYVGQENENGNLLGEIKKTGNSFIFINDGIVFLYEDSKITNLGEWVSTKLNDYISQIGFDSNEPINVGSSGFVFRQNVLKELGINRPTTIKKECNICGYQVWAIGLGLGVFCTNDKNETVDLGYGFGVTKQPLIPTKDFVCDYFKVRKCIPSHHIIEDETKNNKISC